MDSLNEVTLKAIVQDCNEKAKEAYLDNIGRVFDSATQVAVSLAGMGDTKDDIEYRVRKYVINEMAYYMTQRAINSVLSHHLRDHYESVATMLYDNAESLDNLTKPTKCGKTKQS